MHLLTQPGNKATVTVATVSPLDTPPEKLVAMLWNKK